MLKHDLECFFAYGRSRTPDSGGSLWVQAGSTDKLAAVKELFPEATAIKAYCSDDDNARCEVVAEDSLHGWLSVRPQLQLVLPQRLSDRTPCQACSEVSGAFSPICVDPLVQAPVSAAHSSGAFRATTAVFTALIADVDLALPLSAATQLTNLEALPVKRLVQFTEFASPVLMTHHHPPILVQCPLWPAGSSSRGGVVALKEAMLTVFSFDDGAVPTAKCGEANASVGADDGSNGDTVANRAFADAADCDGPQFLRTYKDTPDSTAAPALPHVKFSNERLGPMLGLSGLSKLGLVLSPTNEGSKVM